MKRRVRKLPLDDEKIIDLYFDRDDMAIAETEFKYKNYLFSVAYNVIRDSFYCDECLNDSYLGAWNAMPPTRPASLKAFLTVIVRRIAVKRYHALTKKKEIPSEMKVSLTELEDLVSGDGDVGESFDAEKLASVISEYVRSLNERRRYIFMSRYYASEPIDTIAGLLRVSRSTVNKELAAIKLALKEKLESEGYTV